MQRLVIKSDASLSAGFRIGSKNGSAFYDFSAEEVAALFSAYLNPKTTEIMKKAAAGISEEEPKPAVEEEKKPAASKAKKTTAKPAAKSRAKTTKETK